MLIIIKIMKINHSYKDFVAILHDGKILWELKIALYIKGTYSSFIMADSRKNLSKYLKINIFKGEKGVCLSWLAYFDDINQFSQKNCGFSTKYPLILRKTAIFWRNILYSHISLKLIEIYHIMTRFHQKSHSLSKYRHLSSSWNIRTYIK